jgi:hypothetical protein
MTVGAAQNVMVTVAGDPALGQRMHVNRVDAYTT